MNPSNKKSIITHKRLFSLEQLTGKICLDSFSCSISEKELHNLDYPFMTVPAMKIAKLAVSAPFQEKYYGIGSLMIEMAIEIAGACNEQFFACRFITVDADIEHNESVITFYLKNGFISNEETNNKRRKTVSMRRDILFKTGS